VVVIALVHAFSAAHPVLSALAIVGICWCTASLVLTGIWIACFPTIRYVPQAPGRASDRRKVS
jgi:hypothetical protein